MEAILANHIIRCSVDIKFEPGPPPDAVFGLVYSLINADYSQHKKLPILQLPEEIRAADPQLIFAPHYEMQGDPYTVLVGPKVVCVCISADYPGWENLEKETNRIYTLFVEHRILNSVSRLSLRFVNFFKENILKQETLRITLGKDDIVENRLVLRTTFLNPPFVTVLHVTNDAQITVDGEILSGSVIDIETYIENPEIDEFAEVLDSAYQLSKKSYKSLLPGGKGA